MGLAGAERIFALLDEEPETDEGYVTLVNAQVNPDTWEIEEADHHTGLWAWKHPHRADGTVTYEPLRGDVQMDDVDFGYTPDHEVLHGVSVYAKPGQKIAFVGATGAGKTTITNLINRFYDIADGKIRYDGINVNKIRKADLRRSLGVVLQDVNLFTGTVMDNIRYGNLEATDEECIHAAELAGADDFIRRLPEGYDTMLTGNGSQLSQGQRQLISIARAAVADPPAMSVSVYAKPGQKIAFVGATGAGKTTITNLINRFYDIADGKIRYDGINVNKIRKADLRRSLGVVLQDVNLFTGTVMDNIRYGNLEATDEECIHAAELAGADDFIRRLPEGYDTMLTGNGSQLSQGQRQLISIARAAVADPPAMILDEATSSIDTRTEAIVQRGMDALMQGRTTFVIAHRLSTVRNSDVIICLDQRAPSTRAPKPSCSAVWTRSCRVERPS